MTMTAVCRLLAVVACGVALLATGWPTRAQEPLVADLTEYRVAITTGFVGTDVYVFGAKSEPGDVVVVIRGPTVRYAVRRKDRIAGIWLNARRLDFRGVPSFYTIASTRPLDELMSSASQLREEIGLDNLSLVPDEAADPAEAAAFRAALLRIKQAAGLFAGEPGTISIQREPLFKTRVHFPANVPTGSYDIRVLLIRDGEIVSAQTVPLQVSKSGIDALVYEFAHRQAAAYGLVAILGALLAGWIAHLVFRKL
jgi:uncharacterized protein (TIGR02186 family)